MYKALSNTYVFQDYDIIDLDRIKENFENPIVVDMTKDFQRESDVEPSYMADMALGTLNIVPRFADDLVSTGEDLASWVLDKDIEILDIPKWGETQTGAGKLVEGVGAFALGMLAGNKWGQGMKIANALKLGGKSKGMFVSAYNGAFADFIVGTTDEGNLSNLIIDHTPVRDTFIAELLPAHQEGDSALMKRAKNVLEGGAVGIATDYAFQIAGKAIKHYAQYYKGLTNADKKNVLKEFVHTPEGAKIFDELGAKAMDRSTIKGKFMAELEGATNYIEARFDKAKNVALGGNARYILDQASEKQYDKFVDDVVNEHIFSKSDLSAYEIQDIGSRLMDRLDTIVKYLNETEVKTKGWNESDKALVQYYGELKSKYKDALNSDNKILKEMMVTATKAYDGTRNADVQVQHAILTLNAVSDQFYKTTKQYVEGGKNNLVVRSQMIKDLTDYLDMSAVFKGLKSNFGRGLNSAKKLYGVRMADLAKMSDSELRSIPNFETDLTKMFEALGVDNLDDFAQAIVDSDGDILKMFNSVGKTRSEADKIVDGWEKFIYQNMLGVAGRALDFISNGINYTLQNAIYTPISVWRMTNTLGVKDINRVTMTGRLVAQSVKKFTSSAGVQLKVLSNPQLFTDYKAFSDGIEALNNKDTLQFGRDLDRINDEFAGTSLARGQGLGNIGEYKFYQALKKTTGDSPVYQVLEGVLSTYDKVSDSASAGLMKRIDQTFRQATRDMQIETVASINGLNSGKTLAQINNDIAMYNKVLADRDEMLLKGEIIPPNYIEKYKEVFEAEKQANRIALETTFQSDIEGMFSFLNRSGNIKNPALRALKTLVIPFVRTPMNLIIEAMEMTPVVGKGMKRMRDDLSGKNGEYMRMRAQAKQAIGTMAYSSAYMLAQSGVVQGRYLNQEDKRLKMAQGIQEYSINLGGNSYKFSRYDPFAMVLGMTADLVQSAEYLEEGETAKFSAGIIYSFSNNILEKSWMKGLSDLIEAMANPEMRGEMFISNFIRQHLPQASNAGFVTRSLDPEMKAMSDVLDRTLVNVYARGKLETRYNYFGEEVDKKHDGIYGAMLELTGTNPQKRTSDPLVHEMERLRYIPSYKAPSTIETVKLTKEEKLSYMRYLSDVNARQRYTDLMLRPSFSKLSDASKVRELKKLERKLRKEAGDLYRKDNTGLDRDIKRKRVYQKQQKQQIQGLLEDVQ